MFPPRFFLINLNAQYFLCACLSFVKNDVKGSEVIKFVYQIVETLRPSMTLWLIWAILFALMPSLRGQTSSWNQVREMRHLKCRVFYYQEAGNPSSFYWSKCIDDYWNDGRVYNTWNKCVRLCCSSQNQNQYPRPSLAAIDACQEYNNNPSGMLSSGVILAIVLSVVLGPIILFAIIMCLCSICKKDEPIQQPGVQSSQNLRQNQLQSKPCSWISNTEQKQLQDQDNSCTICLGSQPIITAELSCGHMFHPKCILEWLNKSPICPNCRSPSNSNIKIYCQGCQFKHLICDRIFLSKVPNILSLSCQGCLQYPNQLQTQRKMFSQRVIPKERITYFPQLY